MPKTTPHERDHIASTPAWPRRQPVSKNGNCRDTLQAQHAVFGKFRTQLEGLCYTVPKGSGTWSLKNNRILLRAARARPTSHTCVSPSAPVGFTFARVGRHDS